MPIKYAEITIVRNFKKESWGSYFKNLMGEENIITNNDTIILSFEDGDVGDTKTGYIDKQFTFGSECYRGIYPIYFGKPGDHKSLFLQHPRIENGLMKMDFKPIFKDYSKFATAKKEASIYNAIYENINVKEVFAIVKNGYNHRYLLAYDDTYLDKSDIFYFIHCLFTNSFTYYRPL
jgi:hypothetical protein